MMKEIQLYSRGLLLVEIINPDIKYGQEYTLDMCKLLCQRVFRDSGVYY